METQKKSALAMQHIRWQQEEWAWLAQVAKAIGTTRSAFIRTAALNSAKAMNSFSPSYFVSEATATPQNTRINLFLTEGKQKLVPGGEQDAADCSRSDGEAKGGSTSALPVHKLNELMDGKA